MGSRKIVCPRCKRTTEYDTGNLFRPFCSERCQLLDLGQWAAEKFTIAGEEAASNPEVNEKSKEGSEEDELPPRHLLN